MINQNPFDYTNHKVWCTEAWEICFAFDPMLHALCVASKDKTQKELRSLVSCKPRDTKKISANIRKIGKKRIRVSNRLPDIWGYPGFWVGKLIACGFEMVLTGF